MSANQDNQDNQEQQGARVSQEQVNALQVLIQAVNVAQQRGAFKLEEAETVSQAVKKFVVKKEETEQNVETDTSSADSPQVI